MIGSPQRGWAGASPPNTEPRMLVGERQRRLYPLDPAKVEYIEANKNYVTFWVANIEYISRDSIKRLSTVLEPLGFVRIERSVIINIYAVLFAQRAGRRAFAFTMSSGACVHSSGAFREAILRSLPLARPEKRSGALLAERDR